MYTYSAPSAVSGKICRESGLPEMALDFEHGLVCKMLLPKYSLFLIKKQLCHMKEKTLGH